jgi:mannosyl-3-phosphoglycerate phosphatase
MKTKIIVFTDLDGTLLDHEDYSYHAAEPALEFIRKYNVPLIFTTSKTAIEVEELCKKTNFFHPFISENGGLLAVPENYFSKQETLKEYKKHVIGKSRKEIDAVLMSLASSYKFKTFNEMSTEELVNHTGLEPYQAHNANQRDSTEPLLWLDDPLKLVNFTSQLERKNLTLISGGRFHHVMGIHDKATTMNTLLSKFEDDKSTKIISIALGDSPNDLKMLHTATYGIVIPNPHAPKMCIDNHANLRKAEQPGPEGWNDSILTLLKELI